MSYRPFVILSAMSAFCFSVAACSNDRNDNAATGEATPMAVDASGNFGSDAAYGSNAAVTAGSAAEAFLLDAIRGNNSEMKFGRLATEKGSSKAVKDFGTMLVNDHGKAGADALTLATSAGLARTNGTKPEADAEYAKLEALTGAEFDKEFTRFMIEEHQKTIAKFETAAKDTQNAAVADFARKSLPTLRKHLERAQSLAK